MKKLLLFTTLPMIAFLSSFAGKDDVKTIKLTDVKTISNTNDSTGVTSLVSEESNNASSTVELNPQAVKFVADYKVREGSNLNKIKTTGKKHLDAIDNILGKFGVPAELKYLSIIESNLNFKAVSWAGARGPWQLMPATARLLGLRVSKGVDERTNLAKSTQAAAKYLNQLYRQYNDWLLVIAAYNAGPGNVNKAIRKAGSRNFWSLQNYLPTETRNHVKKFIATHYIMEGNGSIATMTKAEAESFFNSQEESTDETMEDLTATK